MSQGSHIFAIASQYTTGYETSTPQNDAADDIIRYPDTHLLSQQDLFKAEGGWNNVALSVGLGAAFALGVFAY